MADMNIDIPVAELRDILDARAFLTSRATEGSVHPDETRAHNTALTKALDGHRAEWGERKDRTDDAIAALIARARALSST